MKKFLLLIIGFLLVPAQVHALTEAQRKTLNSGVYYFNTEESTVCGSVGIVNGSVDRFLQVLAFQESGGDIQAEAGTSSASGKYQYINSTWKSSSATYYGPGGAYARAKFAPEPVQDAVAYLEYTKKFKDYGNDLFKLALSHFYPVAITDPSKLDIVPSGNVITPRQYADKLIGNIGSDIGKDIPLLYAQAPEFDSWLSKVGGAAPTVNGGGTGGGGGCGNSAIGGTVVQIAQQELATGAKESDDSYLKYTGGVRDPWCGYFVSWIFEQAGQPFEGGPLPAVTGMQAYAQEKGFYHPKGEAGFVPQPGDVVIYNEDLSPYPSHVNIVISYDPASNKITTIGGNESSAVKQATWDATLPAITGYMRVQ